MSLGDVVGHAGLAGYAEVALILFVAAFLAIAVWTLLPRRKQEFDEASRLPLDDERMGPAGPGAKP